MLLRSAFRHTPWTRLISSLRVRQLHSGAFESTAELEAFVAQPSWSLGTFLPSAKDDLSTVTKTDLHHFLRLSALPLPVTHQEEKSMLRTLASQLHFVRELQGVSTADVVPMRSLNDETIAAQQESTYSLESLRAQFEKEEIMGKHYKRVRRIITAPQNIRGEHEWEVLDKTEKATGRYFTVDTSTR